VPIDHDPPLIMVAGHALSTGGRAKPARRPE
jgi:hypothetical protein